MIIDAKIYTCENFVLQKILQIREILNPRNFVPMRYQQYDFHNAGYYILINIFTVNGEIITELNNCVFHTLEGIVVKKL